MEYDAWVVWAKTESESCPTHACSENDSNEATVQTKLKNKETRMPPFVELFFVHSQYIKLYYKTSLEVLQWLKTLRCLPSGNKIELYQLSWNTVQVQVRARTENLTQCLVCLYVPAGRTKLDWDRQNDGLLFSLGRTDFASNVVPQDRFWGCDRPYNELQITHPHLLHYGIFSETKSMTNSALVRIYVFNLINVSFNITIL